ncbi:MAG: hypothetical protein GXP49_01900 [Deltaproteobacteria bacterium]|nr:hypothetical protein [Deltaproteobacteria bacterium]
MQDRETKTAHFGLMRWVAWSAGISAFALISGLIWVSTLKVEVATRVFGQRVIVSGERAALRLGVVDARTGRFMPGAKINVSLESEKGIFHILKGKKGIQDTVGINFIVPKGLYGRSDYLVKSVLNGHEELRRIGIRILKETELGEGGEKYRDNDLHVTGDKAPRITRLGGDDRIELFAFPEGPALVSGMENELFFVIAGKGGEPLQATLKLDLVPGGFAAGPSGLITVKVKPRFGRWYKIHAQVTTEDQRTASFLVELQVPPVQVIVRPRARVLKKGLDTSVSISSFRNKTFIYCDVWSQGRWILTKAVKTLTGKAEIPLRFEHSSMMSSKALSGPLMIQSYLNPFNPGRAHDERLIFVGNNVNGCNIAHKLTVAGYVLPAFEMAWNHLDGAVCRDTNMTRAALASALKGFHPPPLLLDSFNLKQEELKAFKSRVRWVLAGLLGGGGGIFLLVIYIIVLGNYRTGQKAMNDALTEESGPISSSRPQGATIELFALMTIIALALAGLVYLLVSLRWRM